MVSGPEITGTVRDYQPEPDSRSEVYESRKTSLQCQPEHRCKDDCDEELMEASIKINISVDRRCRTKIHPPDLSVVNAAARARSTETVKTVNPSHSNSRRGLPSSHRLTVAAAVTAR